MYKKAILLIVLVTVFLLAISCSGTKQEGNPGIGDNRANDDSASGQEQTSTPVPQITTVQKDPLKEELESMTLDEKIGQMVVVGLDGYTLDSNALAMIERYHVGGFILFADNIRDSKQAVDLINTIKESNRNSRVPLFISVDEEGGRVTRMPAELKRLPTNKAIGKINNADFSYRIGNVIAEEIKSFGFNMDFAPVLDINSNPKNPVIGDRSFGSNAEVVKKLGVQTIKGLQSGGIIPAAKHFPGHGDTSVDSHIGLPSVDNDMKRLESFELIPFAEAIKNDVGMIMAAHILLPKIDPKYPASLSGMIITGILREKLGFKGVVITDDMTMGAITKNFEIRNAAVTSVNAGSDIVLVCHGNENETAVIQALKMAVEGGRISEDRVNESVYRILSLKGKYHLNDNPVSMIDIKNINSKIQKILDTSMKTK